jgi:hypothetical protein
VSWEVEFMAMLRAVAGVTLSANPALTIPRTRVNVIPKLRLLNFMDLSRSRAGEIARVQGLGGRDPALAKSGGTMLARFAPGTTRRSMTLAQN